MASSNKKRKDELEMDPEMLAEMMHLELDEDGDGDVERSLKMKNTLSHHRSLWSFWSLWSFIIE